MSPATALTSAIADDPHVAEPAAGAAAMARPLGVAGERLASGDGTAVLDQRQAAADHVDALAA